MVAFGGEASQAWKTNTMAVNEWGDLELPAAAAAAAATANRPLAPSHEATPASVASAADPAAPGANRGGGGGCDGIGGPEQPGLIALKGASFRWMSGKAEDEHAKIFRSLVEAEKRKVCFCGGRGGVVGGVRGVIAGRGGVKEASLRPRRST